MEREFMVIGYRADASEVALLETKVKASGLTRSEFLRRLVAQAEVTPVKIRFKNNGRGVNDLTLQHTTTIGA